MHYVKHTGKNGSTHIDTNLGEREQDFGGEHRHNVHLYGWDCETQSWNGPNELEYTLQGARRILQKLRNAPGAWYGKLSCSVPDEPPLSFHTIIHDLGDAGLALIDMEDSTSGPMEVLAVIPNQRLARIRPDFAFEFLAFLRFLGGHASIGSELTIHDYIQNTLDTDRESSLIFSINIGSIVPEVDIVLSRHIERLSMSMLQWLSEKDAGREQ